MMAATVAGAADGRLIDAVKRGDAQTIRTLIVEGVEVDSRHPDGSTALLWAVYRGDTVTVEALLAQGADFDAANEYGETPLSLACQNRDEDLVGLLLNAGANPNAVKPTGETVIMTAVRIGHLEIVETLLARGAEVGARETQKGQTALAWAVAGRHLAIVRSLIAAGANVNVASHSGATPLHFAVQQGDLKVLELLLAAGAFPDATMSYKLIDDNLQSYIESFDRVTPLSLAIEICWRDAPEMAMLGTPPQRSPYASCAGNTELGTALLRAGADPNLANSTKISPLHRAVQARMLGLVKALVGYGAVVDGRIPETARRAPPGRETVAGRAVFEFPVGGTPFLLASLGPNPATEIMEVLIDSGADIRIPTRGGETPLMAVAGLVEIRPATGIYSARTKLAPPPVILQAAQLAFDGGGVNGVDETGNSALHGAVKIGSTELVQFLAENGASLNLKNLDGQTPLALAMALNRRPYPPKEDADAERPLVELLRGLGATISAGESQEVR